MTELTIYKDKFCISTDKVKLDIGAIHEFLSTKAYWCLNIPKDKVQTAILNSLCFGVYQDEKQIGFARIITDFSTIAYLGDVYILEEHLTANTVQVKVFKQKKQGNTWVDAKVPDIMSNKIDIKSKSFNKEIYVKRTW
jgi:hypothetical protein